MLEKCKQKAIQINFKKSVICFMIVSLIFAVAAPIIVYSNFESKISEWDTFTEKNREQENQNEDVEKEQHSEGKEQKREESRGLERLGDGWKLSARDVALIAGCGIIGMVLGVWYWILCMIWAYRKASRMGVNGELWVLLALFFNLAAIIALYLYAICKGTCKNCGRIKISGSKFCTRCGEPLKKECKNCREIVDVNAIYCSNCGKRLDDK